ncbi:MAG: AAA family ATPase [Candidatus Pacebacteria bacterium]|jgi:dephospho-CoA kinase|nr:AAA family ATPase [Candidatus Paceibacterota bacterium]
MNPPVWCIGITGFNGAGKSTVAEFLRVHYSVGYYEADAFLEDERIRREMPKGSESLAYVANDLREKHGPEHIMKSLSEKAITIRGRTPFIIESVRCVGEVQYLAREFGDKFALIGVDAPIEERHRRVIGRKNHTDSVGFRKFLEQETLEMEQRDPWKQNLRGCMDLVRKEFLVWNASTESQLARDLRIIARAMRLPC